MGYWEWVHCKSQFGEVSHVRRASGGHVIPCTSRVCRESHHQMLPLDLGPEPQCQSKPLFFRFPSLWYCVSMDQKWTKTQAKAPYLNKLQFPHFKNEANKGPGI